ncbi:MAG: GNAT family N-acetyltransferase [Candidatus Melainabacteria bacterium]|nr:GNAT family N-acetyltransferase [Candidatus Melainabacteria bacterium]
MKTSFEIIPFQCTDDQLISLHRIFQEINAEGDSFPYPFDTPLDKFKQIWCQQDSTSYVAVDPITNTIGGAYFFKPQWPGRGSHIATATYMVSKSARGNGLGRQLGLHSLDSAFKHGYKSMQFNYVVSTNTSAVNLWKSLGFNVIGTLPGVFNHKMHGPVDAFIMFKQLGPAAL